MLFIAWRTIEYKTYDKQNLNSGMLDLGDELEEEIPITQQLTPPPPPPPPPPAPEVIEVVEDEEEIEETIIEDTETDSEEIIEIEEIEEEVEEEIADVPFAVIERVPQFPGCKGTNDELRVCFQQKMNEYPINIYTQR